MLKPYQKIQFQIGPDINGTGRIVGFIATEIPPMGRLYIVEIDDPQHCGIDVNTYPYPCIAVPEISITSFD